MLEQLQAYHLVLTANLSSLAVEIKLLRYIVSNKKI